jgi:hypothetical protein
VFCMFLINFKKLLSSVFFSTPINPLSPGPFASSASF